MFEKDKDKFVDFFSDKAILKSLKNLKKEEDWPDFVESMKRLANL